MPVNITIENETISSVEEISEKKTLNVLTVGISKQIDQFRQNNKPKLKSLGNNYRVCGVYSPEPHTEVYCNN